MLVVRGALTLDLGLGRSVRSLGPLELRIAAPPQTVFDVVAGPYIRTPRAMHDKLQVWERSDDMVLAAHFTQVGRLTTTTVETVHFEPPHRISFRLLRGPVPHVSEGYELQEAPDGGTQLTYGGEMGADLWALGRWWADQVAAPWERAVEKSLQEIGGEAERLAARGRGTLTGADARDAR